MPTEKPYLGPQNLTMVKPGNVQFLCFLCVRYHVTCWCVGMSDPSNADLTAPVISHTVNKRVFSVRENGSILCFGIVSTFSPCAKPRILVICYHLRGLHLTLLFDDSGTCR